MPIVFDFGAEKRKREGHLSGAARCLACRHEWVAVAPLGSVWLECPACSLIRGRYVAHVERQDEGRWECNCGNDLFHATRNGFYCPNCGADQHGL